MLHWRQSKKKKKAAREEQKNLRKQCKDEKCKRSRQKCWCWKESSEEQRKQREIKKDWQAKRETTAMYIASGWYCHSMQQPSSNVLIMRASFETDNLVAIVQHAKHIPSPHLSPSVFSPWAHTIAVWWRLNDWRRNEVKRERITHKKKAKHFLRSWWRGQWKEYIKPERERERRGCVENMDSMQLQLRERFCAREYANSSFVWAVDWPLHCAPGSERRGSSGLGRLCLAWRSSQASFSYTITVSSTGWKKRHTFCQMPLPVSSCSTSKGCREREAGSISKLQRQRQEQRYSLIVTHDLYMYMSQASIHWGPVLILDLRDSGNTIGDWNYFSISNAFSYYTKSYICRLKS